MEKYQQIYKDDLSKIVYAVMNGLTLEDAKVKPTSKNRKFYAGLKSEVETLRANGQRIVLPN